MTIAQLNDELDFNLHIDRICKSISIHLNTPIRLKKVLGSNERKSLIVLFDQTLITAFTSGCLQVKNLLEKKCYASWETTMKAQT